MYKFWKVKTSNTERIIGIKMKVVIQRVSKCKVKSNGKQTAKIQRGLLVLLGIVAEDTQEDVDWLIQKILNLRIFPDENNIMNKSVRDCNGDIVVVSQFTLHASTKKGNRPSYIKAAKPEIAVPLYQSFLTHLQDELGKKIYAGIFGADMQVKLINDGPVTIIIDTQNKE